MHSFLVDPIVVWLPESNDRDEIEYFFTYLNNWSEFIREGEDKKFYMTEKCYNISLSRFPLYINSIQACLRSAGAETLDAHTLHAACMRIFQDFPSWPSFEEEASLQIKKLHVHTDQISLTPDLVERTPREIKKAFLEAFGYAGYAKKIVRHNIALYLYFLTHPLNNSDKIEINVTVEDESSEKHQVETYLPIVESPGDLLKTKKLKDIWRNTEQAIEWAKGEIGKMDITYHYTIGPRFNQSLEDCQFPTHPSRLEQCFKKIAQLLAGEQIKIKPYPLRTGEGAGDPQRTQEVDGETWRAWRSRITEGRYAYRLHYWKNESKYVFSHVVDHETFDICNINEDIVSRIN